MATIDIYRVLQSARIVAVVGASERRQRPSKVAVDMLIAAGFVAVPVNPNYASVSGIRCYPTLSAIPQEEVPDIVNIFRRPGATLGIVEEVKLLVEKHGTTPVIWTQLGVSTSAAAEAARDAGIPYVEEECIMVALGLLKGVRAAKD